MLNKIRDNKSAKSERKLLGRGIGSTKGKTAGKGHKGQKARSGGGVKGFEGGQTPLYRRLPKRGFKSHSEETYTLTLEKIHLFFTNGLQLESDGEINLKLLQEQKFVPNKFKKAKVVDSKDRDGFKHKFHFDGASKGAQEKIQKAGGQFIKREYGERKEAKKEYTPKNKVAAKAPRAGASKRTKS
ncbi:MAG: 50S ribosomal protein L15 [Alphaproteobacteria bacterium]|nr:MAG: 50S ribosomal protein L15 [Alphaproteobacteria bacterium]